VSSWKALSWAKGQRAGSPLAKTVLFLLCERADERFTCFPAVEELAAEAEASEQGIRNVLKLLQREHTWTVVQEVDGERVEVEHRRGPLLVVEHRTRTNGSATRNRYRINHPEAPHLAGGRPPVDDPGEDEPPRAKTAPHSVEGPPHSVEGAPNSVDPTPPNSVGGQNHPPKTPTTTTTAAAAAVEALVVVVAQRIKGKVPIPKHRVLTVEATRLDGLGWSPDALRRAVDAHDWAGARTAGAVVAWLRDLAEPPPPPAPAGPVHRAPWCGSCSDPSRRRAIHPETGNVTADPCPDCGTAP
jgi:hypothetical protein